MLHVISFHIKCSLIICALFFVKMTQEPRYLLATSTGKPKKVFIHLKVYLGAKTATATATATTTTTTTTTTSKASKQANLAIFIRNLQLLFFAM